MQSTSKQIAAALELRDNLKKALDNLENTECRELPGCADEPHCATCWRLAIAIERLEDKIDNAEADLQNLSAIAANEEAAEARGLGETVECHECDDELPAGETFGCEYCAEVMHTACYYDSHECYGTRGEAADAERIEQDHR
jgi:hypothetical protein